MAHDDNHERLDEEPALPREVQDHLGRRLRSALHLEAEKPSYLGETSVPTQFEPLVRRLEAGARGERQGYEAVKRVLGDGDGTDAV